MVAETLNDRLRIGMESPTNFPASKLGAWENLKTEKLLETLTYCSLTIKVNGPL